MNETSLLNEYRKLSPGVIKIFVLPKIPDVNRNTSYLYQLYKNLLKTNSPVKIVSFDANALPNIVLSRFKFENSILHYHWFEFENLKSFLGILWKFSWIILYKILGGKIVWTIHNKYPHPGKFLFLNKIFRKIFAHLADRLHVHCQSVIEIISPVLGANRNKFFVVRHPDFPVDIFGKNKAVEGLNKKYFNNRLGKGDEIFLMFGAIAEYKGIKEVIKIFQAPDEKRKLIIAGFIKRGNHKYFNELKKLHGNKNIFIEGSTLPDADVPYFLNSADYVIFNYKDILTSGGVILAMNYKKKIIVPSLGCIKEIEYDGMIKFNKEQNDLRLIISSL